MIASELVRRSLKLINVPGIGQSLDNVELQDGFDALKEFIDSEAVSPFFVPGIRRHFFNLTSGKAVFSYGTGKDLDTTPFGDPHPVEIENAYIRLNGSIDSTPILTELLSNPSFTESGIGWRMTGTGTYNDSTPGQAEITLGDVLFQSIVVPNEKTYTLTVDVDTLAGGSGTLTIDALAAESFSQVISAAGTYTYTITTSLITAASPLLTVRAFTSGGSVTATINSISLTETTTPHTLVEAGTDLPVKVMKDRMSLTSTVIKTTSGIADRLYYSRQYNQGELQLDYQAQAGHMLVMEVTVNTVAITELSDTLKFNDEQIRYLRYALANDVAGEYGKALNKSQMDILKDARQSVHGVNKRTHQNRPGIFNKSKRFDINRIN